MPQHKFTCSQLGVSCRLFSWQGASQQQTVGLGTSRGWPLAVLLSLMVLIGANAHAMTVSTQAASELTLSGPDQVREGYFQLRVEGLSEGESFQLEQSNDQQFSSVVAVYQPVGAFRQLSLSGFDNGLYYFRAVSDSGQQSQVHQLEVEHYPLWQALSLFVIGAFLFASFVVTLLVLHSRRNSLGSKRAGHG